IGSASTDVNRVHWCCIAGNARPITIAAAAALAAPRTDQPRGCAGGAGTIGSDTSDFAGTCAGASGGAGATSDGSGVSGAGGAAATGGASITAGASAIAGASTTAATSAI